MKRSYGELFIGPQVDEDPFQNKKQKLDLTVFNHLPTEILACHIIPLVARDWLYISHEWYKIARTSLPSDQRVRFTRTSLMAVVANNDIIGLKVHIGSRKLSAKDLCEAFIFACSNSYYEILDVLLARPEVDPHYGNDVAINNAAIRGDYILVKRFVKSNHVDATNFTAVLRAVSNGHYSIVKLLLKDKRINPSTDDNEAIAKAVNIGHYKIVKLLLKDKRIDPSTDDNAAIAKAVDIGHYQIVKLLLKDPRVDPSAKDNELICRAAMKSYQIVKLLLKDPRVDPSVSSNWALTAAIEANEYKTVKLLLKDPRVNPSDNSHEIYCPPISRALRSTYKILKHLLKDPRSDPTVANHTMIRNAVQDNRPDLVQLLLQHPRTDPVGPGGLKSEYLEVNSATTIDIATAENNLPMLQLLLNDPRIDFLFWSGYAIYRSVMMGYYNTAHALLKDSRVVITKDVFENISRALHLPKRRMDLMADYGDFLDLLEMKREDAEPH